MKFFAIICIFCSIKKYQSLTVQGLVPNNNAIPTQSKWKGIGLTDQCIKAGKNWELETCGKNIVIKDRQWREQVGLNNMILAFFEDQDRLNIVKNPEIKSVCCLANEIKECLAKSEEFQDKCTERDKELIDNYIKNKTSELQRELADRSFDCKDYIDYCYDGTIPILSNGSPSLKYSLVLLFFAYLFAQFHANN